MTVREIAKVLGEIATEMERRRDEDTEGLTPIYLLIYDIQRFRDIRKGDDDFGFSSSFGGEDKPASASKSFSTILKEGPSVAVHTLVWCDSVNNLNRTFDRQGLKEFEIRVLFQMSANDSSTLHRLTRGPASSAKTGRCSTARKRTRPRSSAPTACPKRNGSSTSNNGLPPGPNRSPLRFHRVRESARMEPTARGPAVMETVLPRISRPLLRKSNRRKRRFSLACRVRSSCRGQYLPG